MLKILSILEFSSESLLVTKRGQCTTQPNIESLNKNVLNHQCEQKSRVQKQGETIEICCSGACMHVTVQLYTVIRVFPVFTLVTTDDAATYARNKQQCSQDM